VIARLLLLAAAICLGALLASGCAPGLDGLRQACANTDTVLTGGYQLATASMKDAAAKGTAKQLLGCFQDLVASLDTAASAKSAACAPGAPSSSIASDTAAAGEATAAIAGAVGQWRACSAKVIGGL
jgi:hypothetical protein